MAKDSRRTFLVRSTFSSSSLPTIKWQRSHPERQSSNPQSWSIHEYHNYNVDKAVNNASKGLGHRPKFNPISLCPGPVWCRRTTDGELHSPFWSITLDYPGPPRPEKHLQIPRRTSQPEPFLVSHPLQRHAPTQHQICLEIAIS